MINKSPASSCILGGVSISGSQQQRRVRSAAVWAVLMLLLAAVSMSRTTAFEPIGVPMNSDDLSVAPAPSSVPPLRVVGLGDSVPAADTCDCAGFVATAGQSLAAAQGRKVQITNAAVGGFTTSDVGAQLADVDIRASLAAVDLVIVEVGANDFDEGKVYDPTCVDAQASGCYRPEVAAMTKNLAHIVTTAKALNPRAEIVLVGYWNVFRDGEVAAGEGPTYVQGSTTLTKWVNSLIARVARENAVRYADAVASFKGPDGDQDVTRYLLGDGDHPNSDGHDLIASAVVAASRS